MEETRDERTTAGRARDTALASGLRVGRYRLERELGAGGMGVVWLANDPLLKRRVAIKFLRAERALASNAEERFLREARAMAQLSHPSVVAVFDIGSEDDRVFFTMEYIEGTTLARWLIDEERVWREIVDMFIAAGRGLAVAHAGGLVHRDFKPANVLVGQDRRVKVADFGIARAIAEPSSPPGAESSSEAGIALTDPGAVAGTTGYIAPEVLGGSVAEPAADQFAFAISLRDALIALRGHSAVPPELELIVERGLATDASSRYPSVQMMLVDLQRVLAPDRSRELSFGLPPSGPLSAKRQHTAELARCLGERFGLRLGVSFGADYRSLVDDLIACRLDAAWLAPLSLLSAERQVRPVLVLQRAGLVSYHGALVARRDSGLIGVRDLAGKRVGWVDQDSAGGYVVARALIAEHHPDVDAFLGPQRMLGSHRAVVEAVLEGWVDVGATFMNYGADRTIVLSGWQEFLGARAGELGPIAITGSIPGDVIAVRMNLPSQDTDALVAALRDLASDPEGRSLLANVFNGANAVADPRPGEHDLLAAQARRAGWKP